MATKHMRRAGLLFGATVLVVLAIGGYLAYDGWRPTFAAGRVTSFPAGVGWS